MRSLKTECSFCPVSDVPLDTVALCRCSCPAASSDSTKSTGPLKTPGFSECSLSSWPRRADSNAPQNCTVYCFKCACSRQPPRCLRIRFLYYTKHTKTQSIFHVARALFTFFLQSAWNRSHLTGSMLVLFLLFEKGGRESNIKRRPHRMQLANDSLASRPH